VFFGVLGHFLQVAFMNYYSWFMRVVSALLLFAPFFFFFALIQLHPQVKGMHPMHKLLYILLLQFNFSQTMQNKKFDIHVGVEKAVIALKAITPSAEPALILTDSESSDEE
jgi:hypothetical protein